jgi:methionine-rich copper-binding protein CopC
MYKFSKKNIFNKLAVGMFAAIFAFASVLSTLPSSIAHAAGLDAGLTAVAQSEDASKTTLGVGDQLIVQLNYQSSANDIKPNGACTVNGKDVGASFQDHGDGTYQLVYTVAAGDPSAAAGAIPFSCSFNEVEAGTNNPTGNSGVVTGFTSANNLAISTDNTNTGGTTGGDNTGGTTGGDNTGGNTGGDNTGGGTTNTIANATVTATPNNGTLGVGNTITIDINQLDHMADLTMADSFCKINNVEVTNMQNLGGGHYQFTHTYTTADADIAAGQLTFTCNVKNGAGQTAVLHFTDNNTVAIATQPNGGNNGLPPAGTFQTTVEPSTGTAHVGDTVLIRVNDSGGVTDFAVDPNGTCTVNGKNVASSFQAFGDHTYQLAYTVGEGDTSVNAGQLAVSCSVKNGAGTSATINNISANTLAVQGTTSTGGNTTGGNDNTGGNNTGGNTGTVSDATVQALPSSGTFTPGQTLEIRIHQNQNMTDLTLNGACTINGVTLTNMENLGGGDYKLLYTVGNNDASVAAGHLTLSCNVKNAAGQTATLAFTDGNQVVINTATNTGGNNNGGNTNTGSEQNGTVNGNVQGGSSEQDNGVLTVTQIDQIKSIATADGTIANGWKWVFHITVPSNEPKLALKFDNWMHSNGINSISPANNIRLSTDQGTGGPIMVTGADLYTAPFTITGDLNASMPGKQVEVTVEMGVPVGSTNGSYSTTYHVKTTQN